jgi:hypothetical protein
MLVIMLDSGGSGRKISSSKKKTNLPLPVAWETKIGRIRV